MARLENCSTAALRDQLATVDDAKAATRLIVAINYKHGIPVSQMADWYGVAATTIYHWFDRFEERPLSEAIHDRPRPGRPAELPPSASDRLEARLRQSPTAAGYGADAWTPTLVRTHVEETYGVTYSLRHVRRLMHDAGLEPRPARPSTERDATDAGSTDSGRRRDREWQ